MTISKSKNNLGILASGNGSNLQSIIESVKSGLIPDSFVSVVVSDNKNSQALKRAEAEGIDNYFVDLSKYNSKECFDEKILKILNKYDVDLVILAGYLKILTNILLNPYEKRILNIHPGLLPNFGGVNMYGMKVHKAVLQNSCKYTGCSVHIVTEEIDKGPILAQEKVAILKNDTPATLAKRVLDVEHKLYPKTIAEYLKIIKGSAFNEKIIT